MDVEECLEKGLLAKEKPDKSKSTKSLEVAAYKLERARKLLALAMYDETVLNAYAALFHAGRAILFNDGFREKSHYAVFVYLKERYSGKLERRFLNELNAARLERHDISYGLNTRAISKDDAQHKVRVAEEFIGAVQKLLR